VSDFSMRVCHEQRAAIVVSVYCDDKVGLFCGCLLNV